MRCEHVPVRESVVHSRCGGIFVPRCIAHLLSDTKHRMHTHYLYAEWDVHRAGAIGLANKVSVLFIRSASCHISLFEQVHCARKEYKYFPRSVCSNIGTRRYSTLTASYVEGGLKFFGPRVTRSFPVAQFCHVKKQIFIYIVTGLVQVTLFIFIADMSGEMDSQFSVHIRPGLPEVFQIHILFICLTRCRAARTCIKQSVCISRCWSMNN